MARAPPLRDVGRRADEIASWRRRTATARLRDLSSLRTGIFAAGMLSATPVDLRLSRLRGAGFRLRLNARDPREIGLINFGASMFFTSMRPAELAVALEKRGFDIVLGRRNSEHLPPFESPAKQSAPPRRQRQNLAHWSVLAVGESPRLPAEN
jgi:hypothetical protein